MKSMLIISIIGIAVISSTMFSMNSNKNSSEIIKQEQVEEIRKS